MKNINLDNFVSELLEQEKFDFTGRSKEGATTKNYKVAKTFLKDKELSKSIIDKVKEKNIKDIHPNDLERHLLSVYIAKKIAGNKRMKQTTRDEAVEFLKNAGIDLTSMRDADNEVIKTAKERFNKAYAEAKQGQTPSEKSKEEPAPKTTKETPTTEPSGKEPTDEPEGEAPEKEPEEDPVPKDDELGEIKPSKVPNTIRRLIADTLAKLRKRIEQSSRVSIPDDAWNDLTSSLAFEMTEEADEATKHQISVLKRAINSMMRRMNRYARNAKDMPSTATDQLYKAKKEAVRAQLKILKLASPRAIQILAGRAKESIEGATKKVKEIAGRAGEAIKTSAAGEKTKAIYQKAKEKIPTAVEKIASKIEAGGKAAREKQEAGVPTTAQKAGVALKTAGKKIRSVAGETAGAIKKVFRKIKEKPQTPEEQRRKAEELKRKQQEVRKRFTGKKKSKEEEPKITKVAF